MQIIANENIMATVIRELRHRGHEVLWVGVGGNGMRRLRKNFSRGMDRLQ